MRQCILETLETRRLLAAYSSIDLGQSDYNAGYDVTGLQRVNNTYLTGSILNVNFAIRGVRLTGTDARTAVIGEPLAGYKHALAVDTSETGVVVGWSYTGKNPFATAWNNGKPTSLGAGLAQAISPNGKNIVGTRGQTEGGLNVTRAWILGKNEKNLGTLGGRHSVANDVNDAGQVVGAATDDTGKSVAFLWNGSKMIDIAPQYETGTANAINNGGIVVGDVDNHAFTFNSKTSKLTILNPPTIAGGIGTAIAQDVNSSGVVVGYSNRQLGPHATVWENGVGQDLNKIAPIAGYELVYAKSINDKGQIVVLGKDASNNARTFLLSPNRASLSKTGTLTVSGTTAADKVSVGLKSGKVTVSVNGLSQSFTASSVKRLSVNLGSGNDTLTLSAGVKPATISGGAGNDIFKIRNSAKDVVDGGDGSDQAQLDGTDGKTSIEKLLA